MWHDYLNICNAQLFAGPEGSGKLALAIAYAQFVACTNRQEMTPAANVPRARNTGS